MSRFIYTDVPLELVKVSNNKLIHENSLGIGEHLSKMTLVEHNMLIYADINSLREIYCSHSRKSLQSRNTTSADSKSSIMCCYHNKDLKVLDAARINEIHKLHLNNFIVEEQE